MSRLSLREDSNALESVRQVHDRQRGDDLFFFPTVAWLAPDSWFHGFGSYIPRFRARTYFRFFANVEIEPGTGTVLYESFIGPAHNP